MTVNGKCSRHRRKTARRRGYDTRWEKFRRDFLRKYPNCERCGTSEGRMHIHHEIEVVDWPAGRLLPSNCKTLCQACHNKVTKERQMNGGKRQDSW